MNDSNGRVSKIIPNDTQFSFIHWKCNDENPVSSLCVGANVGGQLPIGFKHEKFYIGFLVGIIFHYIPGRIELQLFV